jgi:voltage-dependent calcium channel L type alpha-1D
MAMKYYRMPDNLEIFSEQINYIFAFVFNVEMILKLIGLGKIYFFSTWNKFDMIIVFATDFGLILNFFNLGGSFSSTATVIRAFRIMRMFKLIRSSVHMRLILDTVFNILPQVSNVMALIFLLFFIYAALGINLFSGVMLQDFLDSKNNFQSFEKAMIVLMKFSTGEDWNFFMFELANKKGFNGE